MFLMGISLFKKAAAGHRNLMKLIGPEWYQELSPKQLNTIDNLKNCIIKDIKQKSIINTAENMAELGLVLRPNPRYINIALNQCCECPVEFLLILYQLMNRHRTKYSLNDRLLLSGVVHLTMRETLKELHIRIPSPPPPLKQPKTPVKVATKKRYKSPYLVPFTYVPTPPKHTGIYKNRHIQFPESPYFSYLSEQKYSGSSVKADDTIIGNSIWDMLYAKEDEITAEMPVAQEEYSKLVDYESVPTLHRPSIYIPCDNGLAEIIEEEEESEEDAEEEQTNLTVRVEMNVTTDFGASSEPIRKTCECKITFDESNAPKPAQVVNDWDEEIDEIQPLWTSSPQQSQTCIPEQSQTEMPRRNIGIVTDNIAEKINIIGSRNEGLNMREQSITEPSPSRSAEETLVVEPETTGEVLITVGQRESNECKCNEEVEKIIETNLCQCEQCKADRASRVEAIKPTFIISGMKENQAEEDESEEAHVIAVIEGVKAKKKCDCLQKYQARVKMYEEMKRRFDAQHDLKTLKKQYIIGGITHGPDGQPVYMLSGVRAEPECSCAEIYREEMKEAARLANMPKLPSGRQKYVVSGVQATPQGNVYVLSGAVPIEECACMKMYKKYHERHASCVEAYQQYLKKIEIDTEEYMAELAGDTRYENAEQTEGGSKTGEEEGGGDIDAIDMCEEGGGDNDATDMRENERRISNDSRASRGSAGFQAGKIINEEGQLAFEIGLELSREISNEREPDFTSNEIDTSPKIEKTCSYDDGIDIDTTLQITLEVNKDKNECVCGLPPARPCCPCEEPEPIICSCGDVSTESEEVRPELKRFIILAKIPCNYKQQMEILKRALEVLAEDGYPLAKLPDSYKLPHFKLWMQLRCGKFWTQEDRVGMLAESCMHWRHSLYCARKVKEKAKLDMSKRKAATYTWAHANTVRCIAAEKDNSYYRQLRQAIIGDAREFFPSTCSYELPTPAFRECYFAYTPAKEEECISWRPWYPHEIKNFSTRKPC